MRRREVIDLTADDDIIDLTIDDPSVDSTEVVDACRINLANTFQRGVYQLPPLRVAGSTMHISDEFHVTLDPAPFASGDSGEIFSATAGKGPYNSVAVKRGISGDKKAYVTEALIHLTLFCDHRLRGRFELAATAREYEIPVPFIPKMIYCGEDGSVSYTVMESMTETFTQFVKHPKTDRCTVISCLQQLCILLMYLQKNFNFMHRDMHGENVMVKYDKSDANGRQKARVSLIDFGLSRMVEEGTTLEVGFPYSTSSWRSDKEHRYVDANRFNPSLDLLTLFSYMYSVREFMRRIPEIVDEVLKYVMLKVYSRDAMRTAYRNMGGQPPGSIAGYAVDGFLSHIFYEKAVDVDFAGCRPENILDWLTRLDPKRAYEKIPFGERGSIRACEHFASKNRSRFY